MRTNLFTVVIPTSSRDARSSVSVDLGGGAPRAPEVSKEKSEQGYSDKQQ